MMLFPGPDEAQRKEGDTRASMVVLSPGILGLAISVTTAVVVRVVRTDPSETDVRVSGPLGEGCGVTSRTGKLVGVIIPVVWPLCLGTGERRQRPLDGRISIPEDDCTIVLFATVSAGYNLVGSPLPYCLFCVGAIFTCLRGTCSCVLGEG